MMTVSEELHDAVSELIVVDGLLKGGEATPHLDELWAAYNDMGEKTLATVKQLLQKLKAKLGKPG